jgi:hypothetical protein
MANSIVTNDFSNPQARELYRAQWPDDPETRRRYQEGRQCGNCSFFAPFNADYGLCCHAKSARHLETVFEHFTCRCHVEEGWGPHSFNEDPGFHCRCGGSDAPGGASPRES